MGKNKVSLEGRMELTQMVGHLERIVSAFKEGSVTIQQGGEAVRLTPTIFVDFGLEAQQKESKEKITIEISWKRTGEYGANFCGSILADKGPDED